MLDIISRIVDKVAEWWEHKRAIRAESINLHTERLQMFHKHNPTTSVDHFWRAR